MYRALLLDPRTFFEEYVGDRGLRSETLFVAFVGVLGTIGTMFAVLTIRSQFDTGAVGGNLSRGISMRLWAEAIGPLVGAFVLWVGLSVVLYLSSWAYSTLGGIYVLAKKSAWALFPFAFANVVLAVAYVVTAFGADIDTNYVPVAGTTLLRFQFVWHQVAHEPLVLGARAVGLLAAIWAGYIAAHAVADVRDISVGEGLRAAAVPVVLYVAWEGYQLFLAFSA